MFKTPLKTQKQELTEYGVVVIVVAQSRDTNQHVNRTLQQPPAPTTTTQQQKGQQQQQQQQQQPQQRKQQQVPQQPPQKWVCSVNINLRTPKHRRRNIKIYVSVYAAFSKH
jgi:hypothetical protein